MINFSYIGEPQILILDVKTGSPVFTSEPLEYVSGITWSQDSYWLHVIDDASTGSEMFIDASSGQIVDGTETVSVEWEPTPALTADGIGTDEFIYMAYPNGDNSASLQITHDAGTFFWGNPARFDTSSGTSEMGDASGGAGWAEGSTSIVMWSNANSDSLNFAGTAEVWDITTGQRRALVPHASMWLVAGYSTSVPAALSHDETLLAAIHTDFGLETAPVYQVTIYHILDTSANESDG